MVNIISARLIIAISKIHNINTKYVDFALAFPQADPEEDICMQLTIVFQVYDQTEAYYERNYILKLNKNL